MSSPFAKIFPFVRKSLNFLTKETSLTTMGRRSTLFEELRGHGEMAGEAWEHVRGLALAQLLDHVTRWLA